MLDRACAEPTHACILRTPTQADLAPLPKVLKEAQQKEEQQQQQQQQESQVQPLDSAPGTAAAGKAGAAAAKPIPVAEVHSQEVINYWNMTDSIIDTMFKR